MISLKIPKGGNQNSYIGEEQTTQWPKEKGQKDKKSLKIPKGQSEFVYRRTDNTMTDRKRTKGQEEFEDTKGAIRIRISKNRQHNDRKKKDKRTRRVWRYQKGNHNPYIKEEQTTKEKVQKDKQRSTKHTYKTKDRVTWTPLKTGGELRCSGRVSRILISPLVSSNSSCSFVLFLLVIVLSVLLRYTDSDCPFGIFISSCPFVLFHSVIVLSVL